MAHENKKEIATGYWRVMYCPENIKRVGRFIFFNISLFWKMAWREEFTKTMFQFPMRKRPFHRKNGQKKRETCGIDRNHQHGKKNGKKKTNLGYRVTWNGERRRVGGRLAATSRGLGRRSRAVPAAEPIGPASRRPAHEGSTVQSPSWAATGWTPARKRSGKKKMCIV